MTVRDVRHLAPGPSRRAAVQRAQRARSPLLEQALRENVRLRRRERTLQSVVRLLLQLLRDGEDRIDELEAER